MKLIIGLLWLWTIITLPLLWIIGIPSLCITIFVTIWVNKIIKESGDSSIQGFIDYIKKKYYYKKKD